MNKAKEFLSRAWYVSREVDALEQAKTEALRRIASGGPSAEIIVSGSKDPHAALDAYLAYSSKLEERIAELLHIKQEVTELIRRIPDERYRELLMRRYVSCERWDTIADAMTYELRSVYRIHGAALQEVARLLESGH